MLRRLAPVGLLVFALLAVALLCACGKGAANTPAVPKQPSDPRLAATATIPAVLPSPIAAVAVAATGAANTTSGVVAASPTSGSNFYIVKAGDTFGTIASKLGVPTNALEGANPDVQANDLKIGQQLNIPASGTPPPSTAAAATTASAVATIAASGILGTRTPAAGATATTRSTPASNASGPSTYTVKSGDTGCKIATAHQISLQELAEANGTSASGLAALQVGQQLKLPAPTGSPPGC